MKKKIGSQYVLLGAACVALMMACAGASVLNVNYQLPPPPATRLERTAAVSFEDGRRSAAFLTPAARSELEAFSEVFALTVSGYGRSELKGAYEAADLFKALLRERLQASGVRIAAGGAAAPAEVRLVLKEFRLDYADRKFIASTEYDVLLLRSGEILGRQSVNGSAERMRLVAKKDAESTIGDMLSETLNKLDVPALFARAGL